MGVRHAIEQRRPGSRRCPDFHVQTKLNNVADVGLGAAASYLLQRSSQRRDNKRIHLTRPERGFAAFDRTVVGVVKARLVGE
jgi:hypothetical protein